MLSSASDLASRREESVQKAFSVDHHGPGDARLSHSATAIYGKYSDYVLAAPRALPVVAVYTHRTPHVTARAARDRAPTVYGRTRRLSHPM